MSKRSISVALFVIVLGISSGIRADAPQVSDLHGFLQANTGKCGTISERNGGYEFTNNQGKTCIQSVGADVVVFVENTGKLGPRQYLVVPMSRIVIRLLQ